MAQERPSAAGAPVELAGIGKRFGSFTALKDIDLTVPAGSFCTFLGPSGSGKTTTLNVISGLQRPDKGKVFIGAVDATHIAVDKRDLGFVFQSYALFPHMTVAQNIGYPLKLRRVAKADAERRINEALELIRLTEIRNRYPSQLSGGQRQRVALARAFIFAPKVLLMDEPLSALDAGLRAHLQREIVRITRELGCTVLYVTHDQNEALSMSDQIVLFREGTIEQRGTPHELYANPASEFSARFVGDGRLVRGTLEASGDSFVVRDDANRPVPVDALSCRQQGLTPGMKVSAVFRPETSTLLPAESASDAGHNVFASGAVSDVIFSGGQTRVIVDIGQGRELETRVGVAGQRWQIGDRCALGVHPGHLPAVVPSSTEAAI